MVRRLPRTQASLLVILLVLLVAAGLRIAYLVEYSGNPVWEQLTVDNWYHHHWAQSLADGNLIGGTTYFRAPLYVYCLGLLYGLLGDSLWVGRIFGLIVGLLSVLVTYFIALKLAGRKTAAVAGLLHAVYPLAIYFESELLLDPLYTLLLEVSVFQLLLWKERRHLPWLLGASLALGLSAITRPVALVLIPLLLWWIWDVHRKRTGVRDARWKILLPVLVGCLLPIVPISLRNYVVANDPVLISSQGGINFYIGNHDGADGMSAVLPEPYGYNWRIEQIEYRAETDLGHELKPGEVSSYWRDRALAWIAEEPGQFARLLAVRLGLLFSNSEVSNNRALGPHFSSFAVLKYNKIGFGIILVFALLGAVAYWREDAGYRLIVGIVLVQAAVIALFFFNSRFRLPLMPYYFVLAAAGATWLWRGRWLRSIGGFALLCLAIAIGFGSYLSPLAHSDGVSVQALSSRGLYLLRQGNTSEAARTFEHALHLDPGFPELNLNLGVCRLKMGDGPGAEAAFRTEIKRHPARVKGFSNLASLLLVGGRIDEATTMAYRAVGLAPYDEMSQRVLLRALGASAAVSSDSLYRASLLARDATDSSLWVLDEAGTQLVARNAFESAQNMLRLALEIGPPPIETDDDAFEPDFRHGRAAFEKERAKAYYLAGYCRARRGDVESAVDYTRKALERDTLMVEAYQNLAAGYYSLGKVREADSILAEASRRFPGKEFSSPRPIP